MSKKTLINIKKSIREIAGYQPPPFECRIKLNQNENPFPVPVEFKRHVVLAMESMEWGRYPECAASLLQERLGAYHEFPAEGIITGNGSNEILQALAMATLSAKETLVIVHPTFALYRQLGTIMEARIVEVPLKKDFSYNTGAIIEAVRELKPRLMIFASPNNPTGTSLPAEDIKTLAEETPGLLAIDEAYIDFSSDSRGCIDLIQNYPNLLVTRTYSKAMNAAGLRIGYMLAQPDLAAEIQKVMLPYTLGKFSRHAALRLLDVRDLLNRQIDEIKRLRQILYNALLDIPGIAVHPSDANFLLIESLRLPAKELYQALLSRGILVRNVSSQPMLSRALRVSVGTEEENSIFVDAVKEILRQ